MTAHDQHEPLSKETVAGMQADAARLLGSFLDDPDFVPLNDADAMALAVDRLADEVTRLREALAEAWDEGYSRGLDYARDEMADALAEVNAKASETGAWDLASRSYGSDLRHYQRRAEQAEAAHAGAERDLRKANDRWREAEAALAALRERVTALADNYDGDYQTPWRLIRDLRALVEGEGA